MKKYIYIAAVALLGLASCADELDKRPIASPTDEDYFKNATDLELFSNQFYKDNLDQTCWNNQDDQRVNRSLSDYLRCGTARDTPTTGGGWSFTALRKINTLLEYAPERCQDAAAVKEYTAIARFFRAHFYMEKIRRFGDVPWVDHQLGSADAQLYAPRDSREFIMKKILEDLDYAIENLDYKIDPYHVSKGTALALKSRLCLFEGTFRKYHELDIPAGVSYSGEAYEAHDWKYYLNLAAEASKTLIDSKKYKLYNTGKPNQDYRDLFAALDANKDEYILAVMYSIEPNKLHNVNWWSIGANAAGPQFNRKFVASFLMKDGSRFTDKPGWQTMSFYEETQDRDPRMAQIMRTPGYKRIGGTETLIPDLGVSSTGYQPVKFVTQSAFGSHDCDRTTRTPTDMPVFRYAEVLLNYAEAKAELGTLTQGDLDISINEIRKRAGMPNMNVGNSVDPFLISEEYGYFNTDKAGAMQGDVLEIRRERCIEMQMENIRVKDLTRWKSGKSISQPIHGMYIPGPCEIDMDGDGKTDYVFYAEGSVKPNVDGAVAYEIGKEITLSEGTKGYVNMHESQRQGVWDEERDYYYPVPTKELQLNPNLTQNPGWIDIPR